MTQDYHHKCSKCFYIPHDALRVNNSSSTIHHHHHAGNLTTTPQVQLSMPQPSPKALPYANIHSSPSVYPAQPQHDLLLTETACASPPASVSASCLTEDLHDLKHKLREIEKAMLGHDSSDVDIVDDNSTGHLTSTLDAEKKWKETMGIIASGNLRQALIACAQAVSDEDMLMANWLMTELRQMVSVYGEPIQRIGAYMLEGIVARLASSGSSIYRSLRCKELAESSELLSYMRILYELCPYLKFSYLSANGAIAEAIRGEEQVHIIDMQIAQGTQWMTLIPALAARLGGPPRLRITGIDDSKSAYARGGDLQIVGRRLTQVAESCKVPFEFHAVDVAACDVEAEHFDVRPGEAVAFNFILQLHHIPDESVGTMNHRDRVLRLVKSLSPKVVAIVEQESNTNTSPFFQRFVETMDYYGAMFESIDVTLPRESKDRARVEQHCLAKEIVNVIACEGAEREERHELFGKWKSRLTMAGFSPCPLNPMIRASAEMLLLNYHRNYRCEERDGALYLGWRNRDLVVSSAWR